MWDWPSRKLSAPRVDDGPAGEAGWNDVYSKMGRPEKPEEYGLEEKYKDIEGVDQAAMKDIAEKIRIIEEAVE